jgi:glycosyltransferase involved in cell wall biosynthesis
LKGKPVITTGYSGVCDFCRADTAFLVDYALAPVQPWMMNADEYLGVWAEPNIEAAAEQIKTVLSDLPAATARGAKGGALVRELYARERFVTAIRARLHG